MAGAKLTAGKAVLWGLIYLGLGGVIGTELDWGESIRPGLPVPKSTPAARVDYPLQPEFSLLPLPQGFAETTARPVFTPDRQPPPPPAPPKPAMQKGQFVLLGALITKEKNIALLREVSTGKATRVEQGKAINGITVANVYPEKAVLTQYDDQEELVLKIQPMSKQRPAATIAPPPPRVGQPQPVPQPAASAPPSEINRALINSTRAIHGLPPI